MTVYNVTLTESAPITESALGGLQDTRVISDWIYYLSDYYSNAFEDDGSTPNPPAWAVQDVKNLSDAIGITPVQTDYWLAGRIISEIVGMQSTTTDVWTFGLTATELMRWTDAAQATYMTNLVENFGPHDVIVGTVAALVMEQLGLTETINPTVKYTQTLLETVRTTDVAARFFGGAIVEALGTTDVLAPVFRPGAIVTEALGVTSTITPTLTLRVTAAETIGVTPAMVMKWLLQGVIEEGIEISAGYVSPSGSLTTWAMNTRSGAVTEYTNYEFNSFAQIGSRYCGASASGIYELDGDTDAGTNIIATLKGGFLQFGETKLSSLAAAYIGMRGTGDIYLKIETGDGKLVTYKATLDSMQSSKVWVGKGLRARYFAWELVTTGQDFDLDTVEFVPIVASRRV